MILLDIKELNENNSYMQINANDLYVVRSNATRVWYTTLLKTWVFIGAVEVNIVIPVKVSVYTNSTATKLSEKTQSYRY